MPQDFSGKNLRGRNFKGQNLTGANFIGADIRGANFANAILREADFTGAKAGLQRRWTIFLLTISLFLSVISGFMSGFASSWIAVFLILNIIKQYTIISAVLMLIVLAIFFIDTIRQGLRAVAVAVAVAGAVAGAAAIAGAGTAAIAGAVTGLGIYLAGRALAGEEKYAWIHTTAIAIATIGGTSFRNADLTDANLTEATLKSTDFRTANLTRTCFRYTKKLDRSRIDNSIDNSILADTRVRELLVTGNGYKKSYVGANLQGANLTAVNLNSANLKQANLSGATLAQANLEFANLTETQALATDFTEAYFTGACLEAWNIDATTKLEGVDCRFIYLLEYPKPGTDDRERRPHQISKCFEPGDFEKLYKKIMTTVQILLKDGINPEAFTASFQKLMQEFPDITPELIQGIEKKENSVLLTLKVSEGTDKDTFEKIWDEVYQARLEAQRQAEQLKYKDEEIAFYRQEIDYMKEIVDILAQQPQSINIIQEDK